MYLNLLNEEAKEVFLDLCINLAESDDDFCQKEKNLIDQFCQEMNIKHLYKILYLICDYPHKHYTFKHFEV